MTTKTLSQWLDFVSSTHTSEIEMGLDRVKAVFKELKLNPSPAKLVMVAGTNGKGSTVAMIEAGLRALGYRVGAYTSPHILSYNERVRINGLNASDSVLVKAFENVEKARHQIPLTYFEYGTLAAFDVLFSSDLDVILLEIGLGGRLDAVNIVDPDISIITSVSIDHCDWLGDTVEQIGIEKAGILRSDSLFIGGENLPQSVLKLAQSLSCDTLLCRKEFSVNEDISRPEVSLMTGSIKQCFSGFPNTALPVNNTLISLQSVISLLGLLEQSKAIDQQTFTKIINAINFLKLPGRLEKIEISSGIDIFLDVGHNPHAAEFLKAFLEKNTLSEKKIQIVYSSLIDKDALGVLSVLSPLIDRCILAPLNTERAMSLDCLLNCASKSGLKNVLSFPAIDLAIENALSYSHESAKKNESVLTLIFGSFYIVEAAKRFFETYD
jgi:dihydrofolate synthase/folylpolyglutamate synthase